MSDFERPLHERFFDDYVPGIDVRSGNEAVTEVEILRFANEYDPQYIHTDVTAAAEGPFGGLIASGWQTAAIMMRVFATTYFNDRASLASPGVDELRWVRPVRPGDVLSCRFEVVSARASRSKPDRGIVHTRVTMFNQLGEVVLTAIAMSMVRRRAQ